MAFAVLASVLTRGTTFYVDEVVFFQTSAGWDLETLLSPLNGHLMLVPRAIYAAGLDWFGATYLPYRIVHVSGMVVLTGLFLAYARPRVGDIALVPALMLLFLGSSWETSLSPIGIPMVWSMVFGLGALLLLESDRPRKDQFACALLCASVATHGTGLSFIAAAAAYLLIDHRRRRSSWVALVPALLYGAWLVARPDLTTSFSGIESEIRLSNVPKIPEFFLNAAGAVVNALLGLNFDGDAPILAPANTDPPWGIAIAAILAVLAVVRLTRMRPEERRAAVPALVLLAALWTSYALVAFPPARTAEQGRYLLPGALALLMVAADLARGVRFGRRALWVAVPVLLLSLWINVRHLDQGGKWLRYYSTDAKGQFAAVELARDQVAPGFTPTSGVGFFLGLKASAYLAAVEEFGSPAFTYEELLEAPDHVKAGVDQTLLDALGASPVTTTTCGRAPDSGGGSSRTSVPEGPGAWIITSGRGNLETQRFTRRAWVRLGTVVPGRWYLVRFPRTTRPGIWRLRVEGPGSAMISQVPASRSKGPCRPP